MTDGRYICLCEVARGGLGTVELALRHEQSFERLFALKRPREHVRDDPATLASFLREARVAGMIRHKNVVSALDVGEDERGPFLVMDYVEGVTLSELIATVSKRGDLVPVSVAVQIAKGCADGLAAAHELRDNEERATPVVHRDVSPQNVMIDFEGNVKVLDFGIAKAMSTETTSDFLKGKIGYMSPEQLRFESLSPRSDLFALGVVLFETLAARRLFRAETLPEAARRTMHESTPDIGEERGDAPPALVALLFRLLNKNAEKRPASAREVSGALEKIAREDENYVALSKWVEEELAELKASRTKRRVDALGRFHASATSAPEPSRLAPDDEAATTVYDAQPTVLERPARRPTPQAPTARRVPWRIGAALLLLVSAASAWWLTRDEEVVVIPVVSPPTTNVALLETDSTETSATESAETNPDDATTVGVPEEARASRIERTKAKRARRTAMRARRTKSRMSGMSVVTEDWW